MTIFEKATDIASDVTKLARSCKSRVTRERYEDSTFSDSDSDVTRRGKPIPSKDVAFGGDATIKTYYEGKNSNPGYFDWVETPPRQVSKRAARANDRHAIKVYKTKDMEKPVLSGSFALRYHMIEIQSPALVTALKDIMLKEDLHLETSETATFVHPFRPLWFRYDDIVKLHRSCKPIAVGSLKTHLSLLLKLMAEVFSGAKTTLKNLQASKLINFKYAWMYFPRDSMVYSPAKDCERIYKVVDTEIIQDRNNKSHLIIKAQDIAFDGESFAWKDSMLDVPSFEGNRPITDLDFFPLSFAEDTQDIKSRLVERGQKVLQYQGLTYCDYQGLGIHEDPSMNVFDDKHNVNCRILIDIYGYQKHHQALTRREGKDKDSKKNKRILPSMPMPPPPPPPRHTLPSAIFPQSPIVSGLAPSLADEPKKRTDLYIKRLSDEEQKKNRDEVLARPGDLVFVSPMLTGYALKNKLWMSFYVDDIREIIWNDDAYGHLVYPEEQKDLVLSFVENHKRTRASGVDDVIMGKGQGLILLLSGPPGTGKTLTAEAVADKTRRPLYYLQAEDLGINPALLGANIKKVFEMATEWDAVILLDEADVFMAERNPNDIARNELVSIFLREIEYFRGIIFLTTNLYDTIDIAFRSRVNIHLLFNALPPSSRIVLWRKFIERLPPPPGSDELPISSLDEEDLKELAKWELNGREIKNAIKTVKSWCDVKEYELNLSRLESGIKVTAPQAKKRDIEDNEGLYD